MAIQIRKVKEFSTHTPVMMSGFKQSHFLVGQEGCEYVAWNATDHVITLKHKRSRADIQIPESNVAYFVLIPEAVP